MHRSPQVHSWGGSSEILSVKTVPRRGQSYKGVPRAWHTTHQKEKKNKTKKERQESVETRSDRGDAVSQTKSPAGGGLPGAKSPAGKPGLIPEKSQPGATKVRAQTDRRDDWGTRLPREKLKEIHPLASTTHNHATVPALPTRDPAWPQLTVVAVHGRHGPGVSRFRANQPETGTRAETGASLKANQRLRRLRTSARKAPDVPRRARPRPRSSRERAFGDLWLTPKREIALAEPEGRRAGKRSGRALERSRLQTRCAGAPILMGKDMGALEQGLSGSER